MKLNQPGNGHTLTRRALARLFGRSLRTIDRWGIARGEFLTAKEAARRIGVSDRKFFYLCDGDLDFPKPIRFGKSDPLWRADELDRWSKREQPKAEQLSFL